MDVLIKNEEKFGRIKEYYTKQYNNCEMYRNYCMSKGIKPDNIKSMADLKNIPLIPTGMFKRHKIISVAETEIQKTCTSSGTNGGLSKVYRDQSSLDRIRDGLIEQAQRFFSKDILDYSLYSLGPNKEEAKELWIAYILSLLEGKMKEQRYFVKDNKFMMQEFIEQLKTDSGTNNKVLVIGPPIFFYYLAKELNGKKIPLNK